MNQKSKALLKDTIIFALGNLGSKLLLFLMVPLYTNVMTDEEYGTADLVFTVAQLLIPVFSVVIFDAVIRFALSKNEVPADVLLVGVVVWGISVVLAIASTPLIGLYKPVSEWRWFLCCYLIFNMANAIEMNYLKATNRNKLYAILSIIQTGIMAGLNVVFLVVASMGIKGYLLAYVISNLVIDILAIFCGKMIKELKTAHFDPQLMKRMLLYSSPLILNNISWWVIHSSDKVMVEAMIGTAALGIYTVAAKIPSLINVFVSIFQQAWGISSVKEIESTNDNGFYSSVLQSYFLITSGACICMVAIIKVFMKLYVGSDFFSAWRYVPLLLVSAVFSATASFFGSLYGALKKSVNNMLTTLLSAGINIIINFLLIPIIGIWGAIAGTIISYIVVAFARMIDVRRYIKVSINWFRFGATCIIVVVQAILVSFDWHIYPVSLIALLLFIMLNKNDLMAIVTKKKRGEINDKN